MITAVDEYVFGFCLRERQSYTAEGGDDAGMVLYMQELLEEGDYPALRELTDEFGLSELWSRMEAHERDDRRFDRNLERLLSGFATPAPD